MKTIHVGIVLAALALGGCSKKGEEGSGLAWTPENYSSMSERCKKALACCEEVAKGDGVNSAGDFNARCSGPALWKDGECDADLKARAATADAAKPLPAICK